MRASFTRYFLCVLLPGGIAGMAGHYFALQEDLAITRQSTTRLGLMGAHALAGEMAEHAGILAREAPILTDPDPGSPLINVAMSGDTVAALGTSSGEITLSLALAEEEGDSLIIRASTAPFPAEALTLFASRTGRGIALYLRGTKVRSRPEAFGGSSLPGSGSQASGGASPLPPGSVLLPLVGSDATTSPAQLLVAPESPAPDTIPLQHTGLAILLIVFFGVGAWIVFSGDSGKERRAVGLLALTGIPLLVLWLFLGHVDRRIQAQSRELIRGDMIRTLALLKDAGDFISLEAVPEASGFHVLRERAGEVMATTLPPGQALSSLTRVPLPPPAFPTLGSMEVGDSTLLYAILREEGNQGLLITGSPPRTQSGSFRILLAGLGGGASLLALVFLTGPFRSGIQGRPERDR